MTTTELIQKIKAEIERRMDKHWEGLPNADAPEDDWTHNELCELGAYKELEHLETFLDSLESEKPINKDCNDCPHCVDRKDQYGWHFKGCFGGPYKGKFIAEIDECPLKKEQPEVDSEKPMQEGLEEAVVDYFEGYWPGMETAEQCNTDLRFTPPAIMRLARHFAQWGAEHLKK